MSIERIDAQACTGCGICIDGCPMDVIRIDKEAKKAVIAYPQECMCCAWCEMDCPEHAIYVSPWRSEPLMVGWR